MPNATTRGLVAVGLALYCAACVGPPPPGQLRRSQALSGHETFRAFSWGKAGVSQADYDQVAFDCAATAVVSSTDTRALDTYAILPGADGEAAMSAASQAVDFAEARAQDAYRQRQTMVEACLVRSGYVRFGLTEAQLARLEALARGTPERRRYLHSLGSDPAVLAAQRL